ncbi:MAG: hypothetical protein ACH350_07315 [Parachlamydiaceae bacterium]
MPFILNGFFFFLFFPLLNCLWAQEHRDLPHHYSLSRIDYTFSTAFTIFDEKKSWGMVEKGIFHIETHYDSFDRFGLYEGRGVCPLPSLETLYSAMMKLEIYDQYGDYIAMIETQAASSNQKRFDFINQDQETLATAHLQEGERTVCILASDAPSLLFATLTYNGLGQTKNDWEISIDPSCPLPHLIIKIFAAFLCDNQEVWIQHPSEEHHDSKSNQNNFD